MIFFQLGINWPQPRHKLSTKVCANPCFGLFLQTLLGTIKFEIYHDLINASGYELVLKCVIWPQEELANGGNLNLICLAS